MIKGVILALVACFIWGMIFIIPSYMATFNAFEIALGRHAMYGLTSCCFLAYYFFVLKKKFAWNIWKTGFIFSVFANIFYYTFLVLSVKFSSSSMSALILGISPILIAFYGNWLEREVNYKNLILPCLFIAVGLFCIHLPLVQVENETMNTVYFFGIFSGIVSLIAWCWYVVANAHFLKANPQLKPAEWATIMGSSTFVWVVFLGSIYACFQGSVDLQKFYSGSPELYSYLAGSAILGIVCSWIGSYLWNQASTLLPVSLAGQLSIFETVFGVLFYYVLKQMIPPIYEIIGIILILLAVIYALAMSNRENELHA